MENLFIDPGEIRGDAFGGLHLFFLLCAYGYLLFRASAAISDGSELLCLVLSPGLVGGLILPVLGAVPDGAIVLFSGLGPDAQEQLSVGVGALAGSTIMLLTVPWSLCALLGRVELADGGARAVYAPPKGAPKLGPWRGLSHALSGTGVGTPASLRPAAFAMAATALSYMVIQGPAFALNGSSTIGGTERPWALGCALCAIACFAAYAYWCANSASSEAAQAERIAAARRSAVGAKLLSVATLMGLEIDAAAEAGSGAAAGGGGGGGGTAGAAAALLPGGAGPGLASTAALRAIFSRHDVDKSGALDASEMRALLVEIGIRVTRPELAELMADVGGEDKIVQFDEFEALARAAAASFAAGQLGASATAAAAAGKGGAAEEKKAEEGGDEDEDEEEEEEDEAAGMTPAQIKLKAFITLVIGVGVVTLFSDPMCGVLSEIGKRVGIKPFYVSFVIAPFVSNASELISSLAQVAKKTPAGAAVSYSQLLGAATMNNTFCLSIFLLLVYVRGLVWQYAAETIAIIAVQAAMLLLVLSLRGGAMPLWKGLAALALYPLSLLLVYVLENYVGLD